MAQRKLKVTDIRVTTHKDESLGTDFTVVQIQFSRKLSALEVSGIKAVLDGEIK